MLTSKFVDDNIIRDFNENVIDSLFPVLERDHKQILAKYYYKMLDALAMMFHFENTKEHVYQLEQNNYQDAKWLLLFLLPYLNGDTTEITSFNDIYKKKVEDIDITEKSPKYKFSNLQYGRCIRDKNDSIQEINFDEKHIEHNFLLLLDTIRTMSHKMYVNWMDVLPCAIKDIDELELYKNTNEKFNKNIISDYDIKIFNKDMSPIEYKNMLENTNSLYVGDIYNVIRNHFYEDVKSIKWTLFDFSTNGYAFNCLVLFDDLFKNNVHNLLKKIIMNVEWDKLTEEEKEFFGNKLDVIKDHCENKKIYVDVDKSIKDNPDRYIQPDIFRRFFISFVVGFNNHFAKNNPKLKDYKPIKEKIREDDDEEIQSYKLEYKDIRESLLSLKPAYLYEFMRRDLDRLKYTYYGTLLLNEKKDGMPEEYIHVNCYKDRNKKFKITHKILYSYAKLLSHDVIDGKFTPLPKDWRMLTERHKSEFIQKINSEQLDWFNINGYLRHTMGYDTMLKDEIRGYYYSTKEVLIYHIFNSMATKGILSIFSPNAEITDQKKTQRDNLHEKLTSVFDRNGKYWNDSYYYLTELPYKYTGTYENNGKLVDFFIYNMERSWYSAYALDWVSQIGFCHHFINNRVSYITGGTGVGKSTQVPKLFMYYTKAIDFNNYGKVVCTQPRKTPTTKNAEIVSVELGLPIFLYPKTDKSEFDDLFVEKDDNSENKNKSNNYYIQMKYKDDAHEKKTNHLVLKYVTDGLLVKELNKALKEYVERRDEYKELNQYDTIIIDEAHEHNRNMDLLLSFLRTSVNLNNNVRLVILSATMDEDEPVYRRYYRSINDNQKYPLCEWIKDNKIDRINVDRRFHISPPGFGTRYNVNDIYTPNNSIIETVRKILSDGLKGDILIFASGTAEINQIIADIQNILPNNMIAVPYHSQLSSVKRTFIEQIDDNISKLRISKDVNFNDVNENDLEKGVGHYTNFAIVATNIAEASITIKTLKYVIETGIQKTNIYDYKKKNASLRPTNISESSRMQRRGRVGRKSDGIVYYLYEKDKMKNNKTQYNISIENISDGIYDNLCEKNDEELLIENKYLKKIISDQYLTSEKKKFNYIGDDSINDFKNNTEIPQAYKTGFKYDQLNDEEGMFYIIHPEELSIERDLCGRVTGSKNKDITVTKDYDKKYGKIKSKKMESFWDDLEIMNFIDGRHNKTKFGTMMNHMKTTFTFENENLNYAYVYGLLYNIPDQITKVVAFLNSMGKLDLKQLLVKIDNKFALDEVLGKYKGYKSDYHVFERIGSDLLTYLDNSGDNFKIENMLVETAEDLKMSREKVIALYEEGEYKNEFDSDNDKTNRNNIAKHLYTKKYVDNIKSQIIERYASENFLNGKILTKFVKEYWRIKESYITVDKSIGKSRNYGEMIKGFKSEYENIPDNLDPLILSFCQAYPYNISKRILNTSKFLNLYTPSYTNIYTIDKKRNMWMTFVNDILLTGYILYNGLDAELGMISIVSYITIDYVAYLKQAYNKDIHKKYESIVFKLAEFIESHPSYDFDDIKVIGVLRTTYSQMISDLDRIQSGNYKNKFEPYVEYYDNGKIKFEGTYVDNKEHGYFVYYHENGQIKEEGNYEDGVKKGKWIIYDKDGKVKEKGDYENGVKKGKWIIYDKDGKVKENKNY